MQMEKKIQRQVKKYWNNSCWRFQINYLSFYPQIHLEGEGNIKSKKRNTFILEKKILKIKFVSAQNDSFKNLHQ